MDNTYPAPISHITERMIVARTRSADGELVLVKVVDAYQYDGHRRASVEALPRVAGGKAPLVFRWQTAWGQGGRDDSTNVWVWALRDLAIIENGQVVEWLGKSGVVEAPPAPVEWTAEQILAREG